MRDTLKLSDFWLSPVPTKTKALSNDGATPLFIAAQNGHLEIVQFLVESGANKDQGTTNDGATPVFIAAQNGHLEIVRVLGGARSQQAGYRLA